jgi:hypothetical protein
MISKHFTRLFFFAAWTVSATGCMTVRHDSIRTPVEEKEVAKKTSLSITSDPSGATAFIDSQEAGETPTQVELEHSCISTRYEVETYSVADGAKPDLTYGAGMMGLGALFLVVPAAASNFGKKDLSRNQKILLASIEAGGAVIAVAGISLLIQGIVKKTTTGKKVSTEEFTHEKCDEKTWRLTLRKKDYKTAERIISNLDPTFEHHVSMKQAPSLLLTQEEQHAASAGGQEGAVDAPPDIVKKPEPGAEMEATSPGTGKETLFAEMAEMAGGGAETTPEPPETPVKERLEKIESLISIGAGYKLADEKTYELSEDEKIKMFEVPAEKTRCYLVVAVAGEPGSPVYLAGFQGEENVGKDLAGGDIARFEFCSASRKPIKVSVSCAPGAAFGLRVYSRKKK